MTKHQLEDELFPEFLLWCAQKPEGKVGDILFWLDYHYPNTDNFWEWVITYKKDALGSIETRIGV